MKNFIFLLLFSISLANCASSDSGRFIRSEHNGKIYWLPPKCENYQPILGTDNIMCFGIAHEITPTPSEEYELYLRENGLYDNANNANTSNSKNTSISIGAGLNVGGAFIWVGQNFPNLGYYRVVPPKHRHYVEPNPHNKRHHTIIKKPLPQHHMPMHNNINTPAQKQTPQRQQRAPLSNVQLLPK